MTKSVGSNGGLSLIANGEADPSLRSKTGVCGKCNGHDQADKQDRKREPGTPVSAVESQGHETSGGLGGKAANAIYREQPGAVNREDSVGGSNYWHCATFGGLRHPIESLQFKNGSRSYG